MSTYYGIFGGRVNYVSSDPSNPITGQVWYNYTSAALKVRAVSTVGTVASGGNVNSARAHLSGAGTQTAAFIAGGDQPGGSGTQSITELYNGTSWTSNPTGLGTGKRFVVGTGTQTAGMAATGYNGSSYTATVETFNGTSWSPSPNMNNARSVGGMAGPNTATLYYGGEPGTTSLSEKYNGTSWTSTPQLNTGRYYMGGMGGAGSNTAALAYGGSTPPSTQTELWNGTSWTNNPTGLNTGGQQISGGGTQTSLVALGGDGRGSNIEIWNGTTWTSNPNSLSTGRRAAATSGFGNSSDSMTATGYNPSPSVTSATEEYTGPGVAQTKTVTVT